jgi:hypothetical protein
MYGNRLQKVLNSYLAVVWSIFKRTARLKGENFNLIFSLTAKTNGSLQLGILNFARR